MKTNLAAECHKEANMFRDIEKIGIAQINTTVGDIKSNAEKIIKYIIEGKNQGLKTIIFPEFAVTGCPLSDILTRFPIVVETNLKWLDKIAKHTSEICVILGFIDQNNNQSSAAIIEDGEIKKIISHTGEYNGFTITVGENIQCDKLPNNQIAIINICASQTRTYKEKMRHKTLLNLAKTYNTTVIYVNQVGATDGVVFDGASRVYNEKGELIARAKSFDEQLLNIGDRKIHPLPQNLETSYDEPIEFSLNYNSDLGRTYETLVLGIKVYFNKTGFKRAVLGLSGGLDSTVCAVLLADALGAKNVYGISMPSKLTSDESKNDAEELAKNLGIHFAQAPIKPMFETINNSLQELFKDVETNWDCRYKQSFTPDNIQARSRAVLLWGISNEFASCLPIATSDKSESYMGYATINGDMSGGIAPIADITKTKLFALARWMNENRTVKNVIPESVILKRPGAELAIDPKTGKTLAAEDALMPYEFMDEIIWRIENKKENYNDMLHSTFLYEKKMNISRDQKIEWLDKFYRRMSTAIYKWTILPPSIMVDAHSINKNDYCQAITSSKINYKG